MTLHARHWYVIYWWRARKCSRHWLVRPTANLSPFYQSRALGVIHPSMLGPVAADILKKTVAIDIYARHMGQITSDGCKCLLTTDENPRIRNFDCLKKKSIRNFEVMSKRFPFPSIELLWFAWMRSFVSSCKQSKASLVQERNRWTPTATRTVL